MYRYGACQTCLVDGILLYCWSLPAPTLPLTQIKLLRYSTDCRLASLNAYCMCDVMCIAVSGRCFVLPRTSYQIRSHYELLSNMTCTCRVQHFDDTPSSCILAARGACLPTLSCLFCRNTLSIVTGSHRQRSHLTIRQVSTCTPFVVGTSSDQHLFAHAVSCLLHGCLPITLTNSVHELLWALRQLHLTSTAHHQLTLTPEHDSNC